MRNTLSIILSIVLAFCAILLSKYYQNKEKYNQKEDFNYKYEKYLNKETLGTDIATLINQAVNDNERAMVKKDENGKYIQDNEKSVYIEIKITEFKEEQIYTMETLYSGGMNEFVKYYGQIPFKCSKVKYNSKGRVKYMLFDQVKLK